MGFKETVDVIEDFCGSLKAFDTSLKTVDSWMMVATKELEDIKNASDKMAPEDRVARTMDLQEDIAAKFIIIKSNIETELALLPQGEKVPQDAQEHKDELNFSEDVKYWAEYKTGIKEFTPWLVAAESSFNEGLAKPSSLEEAQALSAKVHGFEKTCADHLKVLEAANAAA